MMMACIGVVQSLFLATYLFVSKVIQRDERMLLSFLLLAISIRLVKSIGWYFFDLDNSIFLNLGFAAHAFIGAFLVRYFSLKVNRWQAPLPKMLIMLIPFFLLLSSPFLSLSNFWYQGGYQGLLYLTLAYLVASGYLLRIMYVEGKIYFPWYRNLFLGIALFCMAYFTNYTLGLNSYISGPVIYSIVIYIISFILFTNDDIFTPAGDKKKYKNIHLTDDQIAQHWEKIQEVMADQKPYLETDFNLTKLSQLTAIPKHLLSWFFSENLNQSFTHFTNGYRIEKAKEIFADPSSNKYKISHVAYECGFNSLSSFNAAFKKIADTSPSDFKRQAQRTVPMNN